MKSKILRRIEDNRTEMLASIFDSIMSFLFMKQTYSMVSDRVQLIFKYVSQKIANDDDLGVFFQMDQIYQLQERLSTVARQDYEASFQAKKLLKQVEA